jgi:hypothetical protein
MNCYFDVNIYLDGLLNKKLTISNKTKIKTLKNKCCASSPQNIELVVDGIFLDNSKTIKEYEIKNYTNIYGFTKFDIEPEINVDQVAPQNAHINNLINILTNYNNAIANNTLFFPFQNLQNQNQNQNQNSQNPQNFTEGLIENQMYDENLNSLEIMGFPNRIENLELLRIYENDINAVADALLDS